MAVMTGKWEDVKKLVAEGYPLNAGDAQSALRLACRCHLPTVELLCKSGADVNYSDPAETSTPLLSACYAGNLEIAKFLVENGARVNDRDELGNIPLAMQICGPHPNPKVVSYLLEQGADPNTKTDAGRPVIVEAKLKQLGQIVELLLAKNATDEEPTEEEKQAAKDAEQYQDDDEAQFVLTPNQFTDRLLSKLNSDEDDLVDEAQDEEGYGPAFAMNQIGTSYLDYDGDCEEAIAHFKDAIELCPNYKNPYYNIWRAYKQAGQDEEATTAAQKFKDKFKENIEDISFEEFMGKQEAMRTKCFESMPNVSTIQLGGGWQDSDDEDEGPHG
eukprot:Phypoly_transcript_11935.p1 GENE.Phypoly_transcript_11935~~Phypoly_transcript_11935.p1  ORF type:complete len:384 (+),score=65.76 Phypoly_transcript_11935:163-1152(+)